jgi:hypothetical protein
MQIVRYSKYLPWFILYFFLNTPPGMPGALFTTSVFAPYFYWWLLRKRYTLVLETFFAFLFPFFLADLWLGAQMKYFVITSLVLMAIYATCYAMAVLIKEIRTLESMFRLMIWGHLALAIIAIGVRFTPFMKIMWQVYQESGASAGMVRYQGLSYEPAQFVLLISPLVLYAYWQLVYRGWTFKNIRLAAAILVPTLMAFSFGLLGSLTLAVIIVHMVYDKGFNRIKWIVILGLIGGICFLVLPADSHIKMRVIAIATGDDSSENTRVSASYISAIEMAGHSSYVFGVGLGQAKNYSQFNYIAGGTGLHLDNAVASTFAELGIMGLLLRFSLEFYLFYKTKPYRSAYRLSLFLLMFILQFGASYDINTAEYGIWILAFSPSIKFFEKRESEPANSPKALQGVLVGS